MGEVIIAIALWCGEPINQAKGPTNDLVGMKRTEVQVNECRKKLLKCHEGKQKVDLACFD